MTKKELKALIDQARRAQAQELSLLTFLLGEIENQQEKNKNVTEDQVIRKVIASNNECLAARPDDKIEAENEYLKKLLPQALTVAQLRDILSPLGLDDSGKAVGQAIKYLRSNGLSYVNDDVILSLKKD
jgi:hypothetical protein